MKPSYCPACGRNLRFVGWHHECGVGYAKPVPKVVAGDPVVLADFPADKPSVFEASWSEMGSDKPPFDKKAYQKEYMRKRRAAKRAS